MGDRTENTIFKSMKYDFTSYFMMDQSELSNISKVPKLVNFIIYNDFYFKK